MEYWYWENFDFEYYGGIIIIFQVHAFTILKARGIKVKVFSKDCM
jgi:hypothetical protein